MDQTEFILVFTTTDTPEKARNIARTLIDLQLAACVEFHKADSIYPWKGKVCETEEYVLVIKTRAALYQKIEDRIREVHTYELPQIISVPIKNGLFGYLDWLRSETETLSGE